MRIDVTFLHDYRREERYKFPTLEDAKNAYFKLQANENERDRPKGITYYEHSYGLKFSLKTDKSGSHETSWVYLHEGKPDVRGTRAMLWNTQRVCFHGTQWPASGKSARKTVTGSELLQQHGLLNEFAHDDMTKEVAWALSLHASCMREE